MEIRMVSFSTTPSNPLGQFVLFISAMLGSVNIETFSLRSRMLLPGGHNAITISKLCLLKMGHFRLL